MVAEQLNTMQETGAVDLALCFLPQAAGDRSAKANRFGAQAASFDHVRAAANTAVDQHVEVRAFSQAAGPLCQGQAASFDHPRLGPAARNC